MSGYSYDAYGYDAYGYGSYGGYGGGYGYAVYLGPAQFDLRDAAAMHLSGPGSTFYSSSPGSSEYLHENANGGIFGTSYTSNGSYYEVRTSYEYDSNGSTYFSNTEFVEDANGLPFNQFYSGQPIAATTGYFLETGYSTSSGDYSHGSVAKSYSYGYGSGSYRDVYSLRTYDRGYSGSYVPGSVSYYRVSSYYNAYSGYSYAYHS